VSYPNIIFLGNSGSGKSTACEYLHKKYGYKNLHPLRFYKSFLEDHYGLEQGGLDIPKNKEIVPEGANSNLGDILVDSYHFWKKHDPSFTTRRLEKDLDYFWSKNVPIAFQAIRNIEEATGIIRSSKKYNKSYVVIFLSGRGEAKSSDIFLENIETKLFLSDSCLGLHAFNNSEDSSHKLEEYLDSVINTYQDQD
jgi:hypothetical protein